MRHRRQKYCTSCGNALLDSQWFCTQCGEEITWQRAESHSSRRKGTVIAIVITSLVLVFAILLSLSAVGVGGLILAIKTDGFGLISNRVEFGFYYEKDEIRRFMKKVCKNIDAESAYVEKINMDEGAVAVLKVKLEDRSEENVYVYFDPALYRESWENQLRVKSIRVRFLDSDTRTQILCKQAVVEGMEKSFFGKAYASEHLDKIGKSEIEIDYMSSDATRRIATYVATGKATVDIYYDYNESIWGNFGDDWRAVYKISSN